VKAYFFAADYQEKLQLPEQTYDTQWGTVLLPNPKSHSLSYSGNAFPPFLEKAPPIVVRIEGIHFDFTVPKLDELIMKTGILGVGMAVFNTSQRELKSCSKGSASVLWNDNPTSLLLLMLF